MSMMHEEVEMKHNEVETLNDDVPCYEWKNKLLEGVLENRNKEIELLTKEIDSIKENWKVGKSLFEQKIATIEEALKGKTKQLINHIDRDRGRGWMGIILLLILG